MYKKHNYLDRLRYMALLEDGYSTHYVHKKFGIDKEQLIVLKMLYDQGGPEALKKRPPTQADVQTKLSAILDFEQNHLSLVDVLYKYNISQGALYQWRKKYHSGGIDALRADGRGRHRKNMGRPRKKKPEDMTELELLQLRVKELEAENALLKKVKALVEEREARLREIGRKPSKN